MRLASKVAIITGAAGGIGFAVVQRLAGEGARVVIAEIDEKTGIEAARRLNANVTTADFVFLCSPDSDFMTGQTINVDGGQVFL